MQPTPEKGEKQTAFPILKKRVGGNRDETAATGKRLRISEDSDTSGNERKRERVD